MLCRAARAVACRDVARWRIVSAACLGEQVPRRAELLVASLWLRVAVIWSAVSGALLLDSVRKRQVALRCA